MSMIFLDFYPVSPLGDPELRSYVAFQDDVFKLILFSSLQNLEVAFQNDAVFPDCSAAFRLPSKAASHPETSFPEN